VKKSGGQTGEEMLPTALIAIGKCKRGLSAARSGEKSLFFSLIPMPFSLISQNVCAAAYPPPLGFLCWGFRGAVGGSTVFHDVFFLFFSKNPIRFLSKSRLDTPSVFWQFSSYFS
jgi:tellurite resistance protein TehA-like permease